MHNDRWLQVEKILDLHQIKPIVAVIPDNADSSFFIDHPNPDFWSNVGKWQKKGWAIALHGYQHLLQKTEKYDNLSFHKKSEFVGLSLSEQVHKITKGNQIFQDNGIRPDAWIAPAHSFDKKTVSALKESTGIQVISDGIAFDIYYEDGFYWIPQQIGRFRKFPFGLWTICLHPNSMSTANVEEFEAQLIRYRRYFVNYSDLQLRKRKKNIADKLLKLIHKSVRRESLQVQRAGKQSIV